MMHQAYDNNALPIGQGQTISQPYIVAKMTELLELKRESNVFGNWHWIRLSNRSACSDC